MGLHEDVKNESVVALPMRRPLVLRRDATVRTAIEQMKTRQLGCVFILDEKDRPIGKFTERILVHVLAKSPDRLDDPVEKHMKVMDGCVKNTDPIACALECMQQAKVRFICITTQEGKVHGLTGQKGMMAYIAEHFARPVKAQLMDSKLHMDQREGA